MIWLFKIKRSQPAAAPTEIQIYIDNSCVILDVWMFVSF
ncbi:hypothetical protein EMIT0P260_20454 [Pseudomonas sp. IT-P260]